MANPIPEDVELFHLLAENSRLLAENSILREEQAKLIALIKIECQKRSKAGKFFKEPDRNKYPNHVTREEYDIDFEKNTWEIFELVKLRQMSIPDLTDELNRLTKLNNQKESDTKNYGYTVTGLVVKGIKYVLAGSLLLVFSPVLMPFALFVVGKSFYDDKSIDSTFKGLFDSELSPPLAKEENQKSIVEHFSSPLSSIVSEDNQQNIPVESTKMTFMQTI